jgi:hypothetical protein
MMVGNYLPLISKTYLDLQLKTGDGDTKISMLPLA